MKKVESECDDARRQPDELREEMKALDTDSRVHKKPRGVGVGDRLPLCI